MIACLLASSLWGVARAQSEATPSTASRADQRALIRCSKKILQEEFVVQPEALQGNRLGWLAWKSLVESGAAGWANSRPPGPQPELLDRFSYPQFYSGSTPLAGDLVLSAILGSPEEGMRLVGKPGLAVLHEPYHGAPYRVRATVWNLGGHKRDRQFLLATPGRMPGYERCWFADVFYSNPVPALYCFNAADPANRLQLSSEMVLEEVQRALAKGDDGHLVAREGLAILRPIAHRWECP